MRSFLEIRAVYENNPDALTLAGPLSVNCDGDTLLHLAAFRGNERDVLDLAALGADINAAGDLGYRPLHYAAMCGHFGVVSALLSLGARHDLTNEYGDTPVRMAERKHPKIAALLRSSRRRRRARPTISDWLA